MKNIIYVILFLPLFLACSNDDNDNSKLAGTIWTSAKTPLEEGEGNFYMIIKFDSPTKFIFSGIEEINGSDNIIKEGKFAYTYSHPYIHCEEIVPAKYSGKPYIFDATFISENQFKISPDSELSEVFTKQ